MLRKLLSVALSLLLVTGCLMTPLTPFDTSTAPDPIPTDDPMSTRLLLARDFGTIPDPGVPPVSPAFTAGWDDVSQFGGRFNMGITSLNAPIGSEGVFNNSPEGTDVKYLWVQFVSKPLTAQTISGTIKGQMQVAQSFADQHFDQVIASLRVVSNDGTVVRGTLLPLAAYGTTNNFNAGIPQNRFIFDGDTLSSLAILTGDRLVLEVGFRAITLPPDFGEFVVMMCGDDAGADLPEDETTTTELNPWIELSQTLTFVPDPEPPVLGGDVITSYHWGWADAEVGTRRTPEEQAQVYRNDRRYFRQDEVVT